MSAPSRWGFYTGHGFIYAEAATVAELEEGLNLAEQKGQAALALRIDELLQWKMSHTRPGRPVRDDAPLNDVVVPVELMTRQKGIEEEVPRDAMAAFVRGDTGLTATVTMGKARGITIRVPASSMMGLYRVVRPR